MFDNIRRTASKNIQEHTQEHLRKLHLNPKSGRNRPRQLQGEHARDAVYTYMYMYMYMCMCMYVCVCVCVYVCMCLSLGFTDASATDLALPWLRERKRDRERESVCVTESKRGARFRLPKLPGPLARHMVKKCMRQRSEFHLLIAFDVA